MPCPALPPSPPYLVDRLGVTLVEGGGGDGPTVRPDVPAGDSATVTTPGQAGWLLPTVSNAGEGAGAGQHVAVLGGILHTEGEPLTAGPAAAQELRAAVGHGQLAAPVS